MSFFKSKQGRQQLSTIAMDDQDYVIAGIKYNVNFLGSMLVPTPTGHGSAQTENTVEKVYQEKYKAFGYGARRICLEICADDIKIYEYLGSKEAMQLTANFKIRDITYCNIDLRHSKAFVFIVANNNSRTFRAHVFHCDSAAQARQLFTKFQQAFKVKESQLESIRQRSVSAPAERQPYNRSDSGDGWGKGQNYTGNDSTVMSRKTGQNPECENLTKDNLNTVKQPNGRQRSQTELAPVNNLLSDFEGMFQRRNSDTTEHVNTALTGNDCSDDEFTNLAEKRLRSFDDQAKLGTGEDLLLLSEKPDQSDEQKISYETHLNFASNKESSKVEDQNLLQF